MIGTGSATGDATGDDSAAAGAAVPQGRRSRISLRARIAWLVAVCVAVAVALAAVAVYVTARSELYSRFDADLIARAQAAVGGALADPNQLVQVPADAFGGAQYALVTSRGLVFSPRGGATPPVGDAELAVATGASGQSIRAVQQNGQALRVVAVPAGGGTALVLASSTESVRAILRTLAWVLALVGLLGVLLGALVARLVAGTALRPLERLTDATERVARTDDLAPVPVEGDDEIARLAQSFNTMLDALSTSRERQRRLVADAGHELRTPLTSLRTNLDLLAQSQTAATPIGDAERAALITDVRAQLLELSDLVSDLVELSRDVPASAEPVEFDLADVVARSVDRVRRRATTQTFDVRLDPWPVVADEASMERAFTNLLDNAVKWSPDGGAVHVRLSDGAVAITDEGPGIPDADLPHVFERFYRSPEARAMPGSGLGLAIVAQTVERAGGSVTADRGPSGGARLVVRIPAAPASSVAASADRSSDPSDS